MSVDGPAPGAEAKPDAEPKAKELVTAGDLLEMLADVFPPEAYAHLTDVANTTGYSFHQRRADALVMGLWPSRGLLLHGVEVKISRTDWLRELHAPAKADAIARYCDRWWLCVSDEAIVAEGELPATWGLIAYKPSKRRGAKRLKVVKQPEALKPEIVDRAFLASVLRASVKCNATDAALKREYERGVEAGRQSGDYETKSRLRALEEFEKASGVKIEHNWHAGDIGLAVKAVLASPVDTIQQQLSYTLAGLERTRETITNLLAELREEGHLKSPPKNGRVKF